MGSVLEKGSLFPEHLVKELFSKVNGHSSLARLSDAKPVAFTGNTMFTFSLDKEADYLAESSPKGNGGASLGSIHIQPYKLEYGTRVSDEFLYATEEEQLEVLRAFTDGAAKKFARSLDINAFHGVNARSTNTVTALSAGCFDTLVTNVVTATSDADADVTAAIALIEANEIDVTGMAMAPAFRTALASMKKGTNSNEALYPELSWGSNPSTINSLPVDVNSTVSFNSNKDRAVIGNFRDAFRWGYARNVEFELIRYGLPDNDTDAGDLRGANQVYLRCEVYLGFAILDKDAFAIVRAS